MEYLIKQIEQWAEDRNIINGSKPIDQAMKLFSEFGELADNIGKGRDCRDDIGDVFVVLTIMCKQMQDSIYDYVQHNDQSKIFSSNKYCVVFLGRRLSNFSDKASKYNDVNVTQLVLSIKCLSYICKDLGYTLEECIQTAYNDIKDRKGIMHNGVFVKESDPAYLEICSLYK